MKYVLVVPLPKGPVMDYLGAIIRQLREHFVLETSSEQFWSYVIVQAPFEIPTEHLEEFQKLITSFFEILEEAKKETPFIIDGYTHFENSLIGLKVVPSPRMELIIGALNETLACLPWITQGEDSPHKNFYVAVAKNFPSPRFNDFWRHLKQKSSPHFELSFNEVALLRFEKDVWITDSVYTLAH